MLSPHQSSETPSRSDIGTRATAFYDQTLRALLEPRQNGAFVAIHPDTQDYAVALSSGGALRALYARHPDGALLVRRIGSEPQHGLAARILAGDMTVPQSE